jgi:uncharacterized membrane protein YgcG
MSLGTAIRATVCAALLFLAFPAMAFAEEITSFDAALSLDRGSSLWVTETITYDFGASEHHGIFRTIPLTHPQKASAWYKERYVDIRVSLVQMDGGTVPYEIIPSRNSVEIRIGDPDKTIAGTHTYRIVYVARGALSYKSGVTELYWNVTGNEWTVPIDTAAATLTAPSEMLTPEYSCYVGIVGSTERCAIEGKIDDRLTHTTFISRALAPGEGLTVAQEIRPGAVETVILERIPLFWLWGVIALILLIGLPLFIYKVRTKHKVHLPIVAQYEPYEGVEPMYAGMLIDNKLDPKDITAGIVYLAEQGYLKIAKMNKKFLIFNMSDYKITLLKKEDDTMGRFLPQALSLLFFGEGATPGATVTLSDIKHNFWTRSRNQRIVRALTAALTADVKEKGFFENSFVDVPKTPLFIIGVPTLLVFVGILAGFFFPGSRIIFIPLAAVIALILKFTWTRRTRKGYEAQNHLKGFKEFLSVTDRDRFDFHNAPEKSPEQFMKYLPYAIAFGVEKKWAEAFKDVTIPNPGWYDGGTHGAFVAAAFTNDMSAFSASLASASGAGGSGGSASSGGGFSGGGAGGGGGGSW